MPLPSLLTNDQGFGAQVFGLLEESLNWLDWRLGRRRRLGRKNQKYDEEPLGEVLWHRKGSGKEQPNGKSEGQGPGM